MDTHIYTHRNMIQFLFDTQGTIGQNLDITKHAQTHLFCLDIFAVEIKV